MQNFESQWKMNAGTQQCDHQHPALACTESLKTLTTDLSLCCPLCPLHLLAPAACSHRLRGRSFLCPSPCYIGCPLAGNPRWAWAPQSGERTARSRQSHSAPSSSSSQFRTRKDERMTRGADVVTSLGVKPGTSLATLSQLMGWDIPHSEPSTMSRTSTLLS